MVLCSVAPFNLTYAQEAGILNGEVVSEIVFQNPIRLSRIFHIPDNGHNYGLETSCMDFK